MGERTQCEGQEYIVASSECGAESGYDLERRRGRHEGLESLSECMRLNPLSTLDSRTKGHA